MASPSRSIPFGPRGAALCRGRSQAWGFQPPWAARCLGTDLQQMIKQQGGNFFCTNRQRPPCTPVPCPPWQAEGLFCWRRPEGQCRAQFYPQNNLAPGWSQSPAAQILPGPALPPPPASKPLHQPQDPPAPPSGQAPETGGQVTSWIKYLGCHGVRRFSRFRSSIRCFSSRCRFCSVAASMSPSRRYRVTSRHRFLGMHGGRHGSGRGSRLEDGHPWPGRGRRSREEPPVGAAPARCLQDP